LPIHRADIIAARDYHQHEQIKGYLSAKEFSSVFQELELDHQNAVSEELDDDYIADMFDHMFAVNVADFLEIQYYCYHIRIMSLMTDEENAEVEELLNYAEDRAGMIMTKEYIAVSRMDKAEDILKRMQTEAPAAETIYYLYVVD